MYIFLLYLVDKENIGGLEDQLEREPRLVDEGEKDDLSAARLLLGGPAQQLQATAGTVCTTAQLVRKGPVDEGEEDDLSAARLLLGGPAQQLQATASTVCTTA